MKALDRQAIIQWEAYRKELINSTPVPKESYKQQQDRIKLLESNYEDWFQYYFKKYYKSESPAFHKKASKRFIENDRWYEVRAWARELAKDTRAMFELIYLMMTGKIKNILFISYSFDNAVRLIKPLIINLESNPRLKHDYGKQMGFTWKDGEWVSCNGYAIYAFGAGQTPRGLKLEEMRVDTIVFSDIDQDEAVRNQERTDKTFKWAEKAVIPTVSVSGNIRILWLGNIIGRKSCIVQAMEKADHKEVINIRDKKGVSVWPQKNSEEQIDWLLGKMSYAAAQQEYFNNPVQEGQVFKDLKIDTIPHLKSFPFLIMYGDPAPSNSEAKGGSPKVVVLMARKENTYYIIKAFVDHVKNSTFINWYHDLHDFIANRNIYYAYMENNSLQDPFYEQVYQPLMHQVGKERKRMIYVMPDKRKKPDKYTRIEANLEPIHRMGLLVFNKSEENDPNMIRLMDQFKAFGPSLSEPPDGPDSVEGAKFIIDSKTASLNPPLLGKRDSMKVNTKRF